jgi:ketol-acid reductoisomerase
MKTVKITMILRVTDEHYESEIKEVKADILSGKFQREMKEPNKTLDAKVTFELIKGLDDDKEAN